MATKKSHKLLWVAGAGVGAYLGYRYVYQPWKAAQDALLTTTAATLPTTSLPSYVSPLSMVAPPTTLPTMLPVTTVTPQPTSLVPTSVTTLGPQYSGVIGACIAKKGNTWTAQQCSDRLTAIVAGAQAAQAAIAQLSAANANPAAAGIPAAQAQVAIETAALQQAQAAYAKAQAAGDGAGAAAWAAAIIGHQNDINDLTARIAAAQAPVNNSADIAAREGALAALDSNYFDLTGVHILAAA